jgi:hypothetical protein
MTNDPPERQNSSQAAITERGTAEALRLVSVDWLTTTSANRLHHAGLSDEQAAAMREDRSVTGPVKLTCGRTVDWVTIPDPVAGTTAPRCRGCCKNLGYPQGKGSPKNAPTCRGPEVA